MEGIVIGGAGILILLGIAVLLAYKIIKKDRIGEYSSQSRNVFVSNGVNVRRQVLGSEKGAYFTGNLEEQSTICIHCSPQHNPEQQSMWQICFRNIDSGECVQTHFRGRIWCGRYPAANAGEAQIVFQGDSQMSKTQFVIYEEKNRLCLADTNSRNHTYVNGQRVDVPVFLNDGDVIRAGNTRLQVNLF